MCELLEMSTKLDRLVSETQADEHFHEEPQKREHACQRGDMIGS